MKRQHLRADCLQVFYRAGERAANSVEMHHSPVYHTAIPVTTARLHQGEVNVAEQKTGASVEFK